MLQFKYAILAFAVIGSAIAVQDYAVNRQGVQHGIEMHHAYSRVSTNAHTGHEETQFIQQEVPLAQYPPTAQEINSLEEPQQELIAETTIPVILDNLPGEIEPVGTECPPRATGVYPYLMDCKKYINCYKGTPTIQTCPPGTLFNPETKFCDNPTKVKCVTLDISQTDNAHLYEEHNAKVVQINNNNNHQISRNQQHSSVPMELPVTSKRTSQLNSRVGRTHEDEYVDVQNDGSYKPTCPRGSMGQLLPHPFDCTKYIHCDMTGALIRDCGPGTHFNAQTQICDWPQNVRCAIQAPTGSYQQSSKSQKQVVVTNGPGYDASHYGVGIIDVRGMGKVENTRVVQQFSRSQHKGSAPDVAVEQLPAASKRVSQSTSRSGKQQVEDEYYDQDVDDPNGGAFVPNCSPDSIGQHLPHPFDCAKYVHCDITGAFIRDCGPGTHFNAEMQICDWPQNVKCNVQTQSGSYKQQNKRPKQLDVVSEVNEEDPMYTGIGRIDVRSTETSHYGPAGAVFIPYSTGRPYQYWTTTPRPYVRFEHNRPSPVYTQTQREPKTQESTIVEQPSRAHQAPIYHRERYPPKVERRQFFTTSTTTTTTTETPIAVPKQTVMSVNNYNKAYYNQQQKFKEEEVEMPTDMSTLSDALKMLLKPYIKQEGEVNITMPVQTRVETEQRDKTKISYEVSEEQKQLAGDPEWIQSSSEQVEVQKGVQVPRTYNYQTTTTTRPYVRPTYQQFQHSPEWHAQHQHHHHHHQHHSHQGPSRQGYQHNPEWHRQHGIPLPADIDTTPYHHSRHHSRYPTTTVPTTPDILIPLDPRIQGEGVSTTPIIHFSRDPKFVIPITTTPKSDECDGFKCKNGKCITDANVCNGKNDCGDRSDEAECPRLGYEVRLSSESGKKHEGRVEVKVFDVWGYVCDDKFDIKAANVLCKELGFEMGAAELRLGSQYAPSASLTDGDEAIFIMDEVECVGNETSLKDCDFNGWGVHDCNADEIVGVVCKIPIMSCPADYWLCEMSQECIPTGFLCDNVYDCSDHSDESPKHCNASLEIRLVDGSNKHEGRVEVKYRGVWGTICDDDFTKEAADVICRQLGFEGESMVVKSKFGQGKGPIWLDQVKCIGNETSIDDCIHWQWGEHNCAHTEDVGVKCYDGTQRIARTQTGRSKGKLQTRFEDFPYAERSSKLLPEQCGRVKVSLEKDEYHEKVVRSTKTQRGEIPWQASIRAKKQGKSAHWCGAVLISRYHLLTAAHCLIGYPKGAYMVRVGDYRSDEVEPSEIEVYVENLYIHEDFRKGQHMNNDIAIVLLKSPIRFNNYIQPVCLPDKRARYTPGMNCTISGWGAIQSGSTLTSLDLRAGQVPIQPLQICKQPGVYGDAITEGMFCAGSLEKGVDACDGDSGGPLVCESNGVHTLYGIISWGQHCGFINKPGVYVKVAHYIDWIEQKLEHSKHTFGA